MKELYTCIGEIIENAQYLEHNLALMIVYHEILKPFDKRKSVPANEFDKIEKKAWEIQDELINATLGQVLSKVRQVTMLTIADIKCLEKVLKQRNDIVHSYFKRHNFNKNGNNQQFINNRLNELDAITKEINRVNTATCEIIKKQRVEYEAIG